MKPINSFQGRYRFLSNFWPCWIKYQNIWCPTSEHAFWISSVSEIELKEKIAKCATPGQAKNYLEKHHLKPDESWTPSSQLIHMKKVLVVKFGGQDPLLTQAFMETNPAELIEGNTWGDDFWGVYKGNGENHLGGTQMEIREHLFEEREQIYTKMLSCKTFSELASSMVIPQKLLYNKMLAFKIPTRKYLGY